MLNQTVLVGRLTKDPELKQTANGKNRVAVTLAVSRAYKNQEGTYDTDFIRCILWNAMAKNTCEYCKKGDVVGIKGRLESSNYEKDGETIYAIDVIAEKVSFLSSKNFENVGLGEQEEEADDEEEADE